MGMRRWLAIGAAGVGLLAAVIFPAGAVADWPFYGYDLANTRDAGADGPTSAQARTLAPLWSFESTDGDFTGTPVVSDGIVVVGSNSGVVYALSALTGAKLWSRSVGPQVNGSAAIAGGVVYVPVNIDEANGTGNPSVVALNLLTGIPLWQTTLDDQPGSDVYGSPVVYKGTVYIGTAGSYAENNLPNSRTRGTVVALDAATGAIRWKTYTVPLGDDGGGVWSTPAIDTLTGRLYVGTGNAYHAPAAATTDSILELDARTGAILRHFQAQANDVSFHEDGLDADLGSSPNLFVSPTGEELVGEGEKNGIYWAVDRKTMALVWKATVGPGGVNGGIVGSTAWDGSAIYGPETQQTETWSLTADGQPRWTTLGGGKLDFGSVAVANGVVYSTDFAGDLTARSTSDGALLAQLPLGAPSWGGVSISGGTVFADTGQEGPQGYVEAFRPDCFDGPSGADEGPVSGPLHSIAETLATDRQPALGNAIDGLDCQLLVPNGL